MGLVETKLGEAVAPPTLSKILGICRRQGLAGVEDRLAPLQLLLADDLGRFERCLGPVPNGHDGVRKAAAHLLALGGKRLRPICVMLSARLGQGFDGRAAELAVAVELVHGATLLHDDVVDLGDLRRGAPAARTVYGNAASVFAGDWLLVHALKRVRATGMTDVLDRLLEVIDEMILAEAVQLDHRGELSTDRDVWLRVVEGKTAALFRWAMFAGGRAGGLSIDTCGILEAYGRELGIAFQAIDDVLDLDGDPSSTGKALLADVREGKMTWPLIVALERDPSVRPLLSRLIAQPIDAPVDAALATTLIDRVAGCAALADCRSFAEAHASRAVELLAPLPDGEARRALRAVALAAVSRGR